MSSEKPLDMVNKSPNSGPSIMKKRGYEQTNGIDGGMYFIMTVFAQAWKVLEYTERSWKVLENIICLEKYLNV